MTAPVPDLSAIDVLAAAPLFPAYQAHLQKTFRFHDRLHQLDPAAFEAMASRIRAVACLAFSPSGRRLLVVGEDDEHSVFLYDLPRLTPHGNTAQGVASPNGQGQGNNSHGQTSHGHGQPVLLASAPGSSGYRSLAAVTCFETPDPLLSRGRMLPAPGQTY